MQSHQIFFNFSINYFNFNVKVGGQKIISKSVTLKTLVAFFEIVIPGPWSSFSVALYNQLADISIISPTHKRTEGRAPVWGSEFASKDAELQGGDRRNCC
jgi:hypothetical protein